MTALVHVGTQLTWPMRQTFHTSGAILASLVREFTSYAGHFGIGAGPPAQRTAIPGHSANGG